MCALNWCWRKNTSDLDCTLNVNVKLGRDSFPELYVDVYLKKKENIFILTPSTD